MVRVRADGMPTHGVVAVRQLSLHGGDESLRVAGGDVRGRKRLVVASAVLQLQARERRNNRLAESNADFRWTGGQRRVWGRGRGAGQGCASAAVTSPAAEMAQIEATIRNTEPSYLSFRRRNGMT